MDFLNGMQPGLDKFNAFLNWASGNSEEQAEENPNCSDIAQERSKAKHYSTDYSTDADSIAGNSEDGKGKSSRLSRRLSRAFTKSAKKDDDSTGDESEQESSPRLSKQLSKAMSFSKSKKEDEDGGTGDEKERASTSRLSKRLSKAMSTKKKAQQVKESQKQQVAEEKEERKARSNSRLGKRLSRKKEEADDEEDVGNEAEAKPRSRSRLSKRLSKSTRLSKKKRSQSTEEGEEESSCPKEDTNEETESTDNNTGGGIRNLISMFKSGGVSNLDNSKPVRQSVLRLRAKSMKLRRKSMQLHAKSTPNDEIKCLLASQVDEGDDSLYSDKPSDTEQEKKVPSKSKSEGDEPVDPEEAKKKKSMKLDRIRSMNASPPCTLCKKKVYRMEKLTDSKDQPYHYYCLKCEDCPKNQVGQQVYIMEEPSKKEGGEPIRKLYCKIHYHERTHTTQGKVKGWSPETYVNDGGKYDDDIEGGRKAVRKQLGMSMGRLPLCTRCGGEILDKKNFVVSGLERLHIECPNKEDIKHTPRHYTHATSDRMPILFSCDSKAKKAYSFLFVMDKKVEKERALEQHRLEPVRLRFDPDETAYASVEREISTKNTEEFEILDSKKKFFAEHPLTGKQSYTKYDADLGLVIAQLFKVEGNVVHGIHAAFACDYDDKRKKSVVRALALELTFETLDEKGLANQGKDLQLVLKDDFVERITKSMM